MKLFIPTSLNLTPICLAFALLLGGCSSMPASTSLLDQTRSDYQAAQGNPAVSTYAALELQQAGDAMALANTAAQERQSDSKIDALAYLAKQKIALTQEVAKQKSAEAGVAGASKERDRIRLAQRTNEADQANMNAAQAKLAAEQANAATLAAQNQTALAQGDAMEAQRKAAEAQARSTTLEAQLAELSAKKTERGIVITLGDVLFGVDRVALTPDGMRTAQKLAAIMQQNPQRTVMVEGFTDSTGTQAYNQTLSEQRATSVASALQEMGVARGRIATRGYGESNPVASNANAQDRQLNRRVEIVLSNDDGKIVGR